MLRYEKPVETETYKTWKSSLCKSVCMYIDFLFPVRVCGDCWCLNVTVFGAVSSGPCGRSAKWQAINCAILHNIFWELKFVRWKALRPMALEDCSNCTLIPFPFHLSDFLVLMMSYWKIVHNYFMGIKHCRRSMVVSTEIVKQLGALYLI